MIPKANVVTDLPNLSCSLRTFLILLTSFTPRAASSPATRTEAAYHTLQGWYNPSTGLYNTTGWWNAANIITTLSNLALVDATVSDEIQKVVENTFSRAPATNPTAVWKTIDPRTFLVSSSLHEPGQTQPPHRGNSTVVNEKEVDSKRGWLNGYYDDEGWWALAWIRAFDLTSNTTYLHAAEEIFEDLEQGQSTPCGGIWWDKQKTYVNAIANELYLAVVANLANRAGSSRSDFGKSASQVVMTTTDERSTALRKTSKDYLNLALKQWEWFEKSGMINAEYNINDGLTKTCVNNNAAVWSYNQGVILEALSELYLATSNTTYIEVASKIAQAAVRKLTTGKGILKDVCEDWGCGPDGVTFKGVFMRGLSRLLIVMQEDSAKALFEEFVKQNAKSIWEADRDVGGRIGVIWSGPLQEINAGSHGSGLDALVAASALKASN